MVSDTQVPLYGSTGRVNLALWAHAPTRLHGQSFHRQYLCLAWLLFEQYQRGWSTSLPHWIQNKLAHYNGVSKTQLNPRANFEAYLDRAVQAQVILLLAPTRPFPHQRPVRLHPRFGLDYDQLDSIRLGRKLVTIRPTPHNVHKIFEQWELDTMLHTLAPELLAQYGLTGYMFPEPEAHDSPAVEDSSGDRWEDLQVSVRT